jgi:5-methyltetrahydrofolate--homocysteine methyltransferase
MISLIEALKNGKTLVSDGAWGTFLHQKGLQPGECPELWNVTHRSEVFSIAKSYVDSGADIILTNSFGGSPIKLAHYGLEKRASELNEAAGAISREAAGNDHIVLGSMGPTGVILMMGDVSEQSLYDGFFIQAQALKKGHVDAICIETMSAIDEACIAIRAAKEATGLEIVCTFTFEKTISGEYKTMMGFSPVEMVSAVKEAGADSLTPVLIHANAGKPILENGQTIFPETPEMMASKVESLLKCGANIIGGCCGTTPAHITAIAKKIREL